MKACGFIEPPALSPAAATLEPRGAATCPGFVAAFWRVWLPVEMLCVVLVGSLLTSQELLKSII